MPTNVVVTTRVRGATLAFRVALLAFSVGAAVTAMAALSGSDGCATAAVGRPGGAADVVCTQLVRSLAERMGLVTAVATAVVVLTMVGLSRTPVTRPIGRPHSSAARMTAQR